MIRMHIAALAAATCLAAGPALAQHEAQHGAQHFGPVTSPVDEKIDAAFDIVRTEVKSEGANIAFRVQVRGKAGTIRPKAIGQFAGSAVYSYVWPTSLDSSGVHFDAEAAALANGRTWTFLSDHLT